MSNSKPYDHLRAWCAMMGSYPYYVRDQIELARREDAPDDAIYRDSSTGRWVTFSEVTNPSTIKTITERVEKARA